MEGSHPTHQPLNIIGSLSHFFAERKPLSLLIFISVILFGLLAFILTPKQYNPEIVRPAFVVSLQYQGATAAEAERRVVYELMEKVTTVPGVDEVTAQVTDGAQVNMTVIFDVGYDKEKAKVDLTSQLTEHQYLARGFIGAPSILEINPETIPVMQVVFSSPDQPIAVVKESVTALAQSLNTVQGVSDVSVVGGYDTQLVVELDPARLAAAGVTVGQVSGVLQSSQTRYVLNSLMTDTCTLPVVVDGRTTSAAAIGDLLIGDGIRVRDVAAVYEGTAADRAYTLYSAPGVPATEVVVLSVAKVEGTSAPVVTGAVRDALADRVSTPAFQDLSYTIVADDGVMAQHEINGLTINLITSILIVAVVLLLFLSARSAAVVLVAIPTTLLIVFGLGLLFDQTINRITLFALILSLGLLVDSATVVVENIYTHLKEHAREPRGLKRERIIAGAVDEVGVGLLLSTVTSVVVFLPMLYITGMMGPYMGPIAFFVPVALIVSLVVAITITPFVATHLIDAHERPTRLGAAASRVMDRLTELYRRTLSYVLVRRAVQRTILLSALGLFLVILILPLSGLVHFQMLPKADRDQFYVYLDLPVGTAVERTAAVADSMQTVIEADPAVTSIQSFVAIAPVVDFNGMFKGAGMRTAPQQATLRVNLTPTSERTESSTDIAMAVRAHIAHTLPAVAPYVRIMEEPPGPPVRATLVAKVHSANTVTQAAFAAALYQQYEATEGVVDRYTSAEAPIGRTVYQIDHTALAHYNVRLDSVLEVVSVIAGPIEVVEYQAGSSVEYTPIVLSVPPEWRDTPADITQLTVQSQTGEPVSLAALVTESYELRPQTEYFEDGTTVSYVTGEVAGRSIVYVVIDLIWSITHGALADYTVTDWNLFDIDLVSTDGVPVSLTWGGEWEMTLENFRDLGLAMLVALALVYGVLVAQYNNFATPAYILVTVPLGLIGILWGFFVLDTVFGILLTATALIGFIALIGIVVNNAIIFLEYVEQARAHGMAYVDALVAAGGARLRPIILTSLTTILGSLTIASDPVWSGLAWAIVFGLSLSTILTLVMYPIMLVYFIHGSPDATPDANQ